MDHLTTEEYAFVYEQIRGKEARFPVGYTEKEDTDSSYVPSESEESEDTTLVDDDYTEEHEDSESEDSWAKATGSDDCESEDSWEQATGSEDNKSESTEVDPYEPPPMPTTDEVPEEIKTAYDPNHFCPSWVKCCEDNLAAGLMPPKSWVECNSSTSSNIPSK